MFLLFLFAGPAMADDAVEVIVLDPTPGQTVVRYDFGPFSSKTVEIGGVDFQSISLNGEINSYDKGLPALPRVSRSVVVPDSDKMSIEVIDARFHEIEDIHIAPSKGILNRKTDPASVPYTFDSFYRTNAWYPRNIASHDTPYILRDVRGMVVTTVPFQYNPARGALRVYDTITVRITGTTGPAAVNALTDKAKKPSRAFQKLYNTQFINPPGGGRYTPLDEDGELLVITYDSFNSNVQPLATWKNSNGITTTVVNVSTIGNNSTNIKNYIQSYYNSNNLAFVLLVGDAAQVATLQHSGAAADPRYSLVAGGDNYPDIFIGRFSATTTSHVDTQVERTIEYEQGVHMGNWFWKGMGVASSEGAGYGHNGESDKVHMGYIRNDLLAYGYTSVDEIYDPGASSSQVSSALNAGRGIANYCGHGWKQGWSTSGFSNSNVNNLTNDNMLPFITSVACNNGEFDSGTCFAEAWLQATHSGEPTGAVGVYASTISMSWAPPMEGQDEFIDRYCAETYDTYGCLCFAGSCKMMDRYGGSGRTEFNHWTVFGDPSLSVRINGGGGTSVDIKVNGQDGPLNISHNTTADITISVNAGDLTGIPQDWWIFVERNWSSKYWWTPPGNWTQSATPIRAYDGNLVDVNNYSIATGKIPVAWWEFTFAVDDMNGTYEGTYSDTVQVQSY